MTTAFRPAQLEFRRTGLSKRPYEGGAMERSPGRRRFLKSAAAMSAAALPASSLAADPHAGHAQHAPQAKRAAAPSSQARAYMFLTPPEVAFIDSAVTRLIPTAKLGPAAKAAGAAYFT